MSSIEEKYLHAASSSHLQMTEFHGDIDVILAMAGVDPEGLAGRFWRLRCEFDKHIRAAEREADNLPLARFLALDKPSVKRELVPFRDALHAYAMQRAKYKSLDVEVSPVARMVGRVIDRLLDDRCGHCRGIGTLGQFGGPQPICPTCNGSRTRRNASLSSDLTVHELGCWLMASLSDKCASVERRIRKLLSEQGDQAPAATRLPPFGAGFVAAEMASSMASAEAAVTVGRASQWGDV